MISIHEYIIEKLHITKDIEDRSCFSRYNEGDVILIVFHIYNIDNLDECVCLNIAKIKEIDEDNNKILTIGHGENKGEWLETSSTTYIEVKSNNDYLYHPDDKVESLYIPSNEVIKVLDEMKKTKTFDFNLYANKREKEPPIKISMDAKNVITDEGLNKFKNWFNEETK